MFAGRNESYRILRKEYKGDLAAVNKRKTSLSQTQEEPLTVYNLVAASAKRFITQITSSVPSMVTQPRDLSNIQELDVAARRGMFLNHVWKQNKVSLRLGEIAWNQSVLGSSPIFILPDPSNVCGFKITIGIPEFFYPVPKDNSWQEFKAVIYAYHQVGEKFETLDYHKFDPQKSSFEDSYDNNTIMYWDRSQYVLWKDGRLQDHVIHNLGMIPCVQVKNLPIPANLSSEGDFDQAVAMQEYINEQLLLQGQIIFDFANAPIIINSSRSSQVNTGERVWDLGPDGRAAYLTYPGNSPSQETLFIKSQQGYEDMVGVSSPALGRDIPSGTTGPVVSSLLGGFNGILSMKQIMIGEAIRNVNLIIQQMAEIFYPTRLFPIYPSASQKYPATTILNRKLYAIPSEWHGYHENSVSFPEPEIVRLQKQNNEILKMQQGLQSRIRTMLNLGIENPIDEIAQIALERGAASASTPSAVPPVGQPPELSPEEKARRALTEAGVLPEEEPPPAEQSEPQPKPEPNTKRKTRGR